MIDGNTQIPSLTINSMLPGYTVPVYIGNSVQSITYDDFIKASPIANYTASQALTASYVNPLTQSVIISGSTTLTGSLNVTGSTTQIGNNNLLGNTTLSGSIIISGSTTSPVTPTIKIYGDMETNGVIKFMPVDKSIDTSIPASYIYVSGSTNDLYFSQNGSGYSNVTRLRWLEGNLYTGLLDGGIISQSSTTTYTVSSGSGIIVNLNASYTANPYPIVQYINWSNLSASIAPLSASYDQSFIAINSNAQITASGIPYNDGDYNTLIPLGIIIHQNHQSINAVQTFPSVAYGWKQRSFDFIKAFGPLKISGYSLSPSGSSTGSLVLSGGISWVDGRNYIVDPNNPSYINEAIGITTSKIYRYYQSGSGWVYDTNAGIGYPTINPTQYSNSGSLTPVATNNWTIQRVFYFPNSATKAFYIYYGNVEYANKTDAIAGILTEPFNEAPNTAANAIFVGYMILRYNANFTTAASYEFRAAGLFRGSGGGGNSGGGGVTTLAGLTDVSLTNPSYGDLLMYGTTVWNNTKTLSGSYTLSGSLRVSGSLTGSLLGTASYTSQALSSSYAITASYINTLNQNLTVIPSHSGTSVGLIISGSNTKGGTGYLDFLQITNTSASISNPNKFFRLNTAGDIELLRSDYNATILALTNGGILYVGGGNTAATSNNDPTTNYLSFGSNNTVIYDDGNTHIHNRNLNQSMWINTNGGQINLISQSPVNGGVSGSGIAIGSATLTGYVTINNGKSLTTSANYGYLTTAGAGTYGGGSQNVSISLYATNRIWGQEIDAFSDERMKDIQGEITLDEGLKLVKTLKPIKYTWKEGDDKGLKAGYSAQQVSKAGFDHLISLIPKEGLEETIDDDGFVSPKDTQFSMNYDQVVPYHGVVIKYLLEKIEKLENEIKELKK